MSKLYSRPELKCGAISTPRQDNKHDIIETTEPIRFALNIIEVV